MDTNMLKTEIEKVSEKGKSLVEALEELARIIEDYEEEQYIKDEQEGKQEDNLVLKSEEVCNACIYSASGELCSTTRCGECSIWDGEGCYCVLIPDGAPCEHFKLKEKEEIK